MTLEPDRISANHIVRNARELLLRGHALDACILLESIRGMSGFYPSFHIVEGECLIALGRNEDAKQALKHALHLLPNSARAAILLETLGRRPHANDAHTSDAVTGRAAELDPHEEPTLALLFDDAASPQRPISARTPPVGGNETKKTATAFDLEHVASLLAHDRHLVQPASHLALEEDRSTAMPSEHPPLVTETLATILLSQGKLPEALDAYSQLRDEQPTRRHYFEERIKQVEERLKRS